MQGPRTGLIGNLILGFGDIVDTVTWTGGSSQSEGGVGLMGDGILKAVLGAVVKRLNRRRAKRRG
ncbi:hypothetical protein NA56DRAFT_713544 [Hyaloscypha hepaticicola]|uniref:Uncharacterized protein n=1 Tax=Hyaloscypha hepaticicola TaxID=2082293 RepID=A0A2J6PDE8_9HELO|nr:hypothetical protein NA56DRAFT_713544 [Hyaloscypha hepaticicola]